MMPNNNNNNNDDNDDNDNRFTHQHPFFQSRGCVICTGSKQQSDIAWGISQVTKNHLWVDHPKWIQMVVS